MISDEKIQEVRDSADIVEVISSYLTLKKAGANFQGLCPFHSEKTPSFNVNPARQTFHCFGCGVGGDVFGFLMRMDGLSFPEAIVELGEKLGIDVEQRKISPAEEKRQREREVFCRINEVAAEFFHEILMVKSEGAVALAYLQRRGYSRETAGKYQIGFAPSGWTDLVRYLAGKGFQADTCRNLGLTRAGKSGKGDYDFFRNRLIFPVININGKVVAFGGRVLDDSLPKYINSPETEVYRKAQTLYGLCQARDAVRRNGECILVEGYFDLLAVAGAGFENVAATCGTALTSDHARLLRRYTQRILLLFDQDEAGQKAAFRGMEVLLKEGMSVAMILLEEGEDPDSYLKKRGKDAFRKRLEDARPALAVFMESVLREHGEGSESRARAVEIILDKLKLLNSSVERRLYLQELAEKTGLDVSFLQSGGRDVVSGKKNMSPPSQKRVSLLSRPRSGEMLELKSQNWLLILLATDAEIRRRVAEDGTEKFFADEERRYLADCLVEMDGQAEDPEKAISALDLTESQKKIATEVFRQDLRALAEGAEEIFRDCCMVVDRQHLRKRTKELTRLIMEAEKVGDNSNLVAYSAEKMELNRRLQNLR